MRWNYGVGTACFADHSVHVELIPMTDDMVWEDHTVLVEVDRILVLGPFDEVRVPKTATIIAWIHAV